MNKKKVFLIVGLVLILLVVVIIVLKLVPMLNEQKGQNSVTVGSEAIDTIDTISGEKVNFDIVTDEDKGEQVQDFVYKDGTVSIDAVNEYIRKLMKEDGFVTTKEAEDREDGVQTYQLSKSASQENKVIIIDFQFQAGGDVHVSYRLTDKPSDAIN